MVFKEEMDSKDMKATTKGKGVQESERDCFGVGKNKICGRGPRSKTSPSDDIRNRCSTSRLGSTSGWIKYLQNVGNEGRNASYQPVRIKSDKVSFEGHCIPDMGKACSGENRQYNCYVLKRRGNSLLPALYRGNGDLS